MHKKRRLSDRNITNKSPSSSQFKVITPTDMYPRPNNFEKTIAKILKLKFQSDILFVQPTLSLHTPDLQVLKTGEFWEIKNIRGNGKNTIEDNLKKAAKQSENIIISLLRTKMSPTQAAARIHYFLNRPHGKIKRVILVARNNKIIDFSG